MQKMVFLTCSCNKDEMKCIYTGFRFLHNHKLYAGDLFRCKNHTALSVKGIPEPVEVGRLSKETLGGFSTFEGVVGCENEHYGETLSGGILTLSREDCKYVLLHGDYSGAGIIKAYAVEVVE